MSMRRSTLMLILGTAIFVSGAWVVLVSFMGSDKDKGGSAVSTTSTTVQAGTVLVTGAAPPPPGSFTIPEGKQAVAAPLPYVNGLAGYVKGGDTVNIYGNVEKGSGTDPAPPATKLILPGVEVLSVSGPGPGADAGNATHLLALDVAHAEQAV